MTNPIDEEIVLSTIRVARRLNLRTIAEHVHSAAIYERLTDMGVVYMQGDYFGRAMPLAEVFLGPAGPNRDAGPSNEAVPAGWGDAALAAHQVHQAAMDAEAADRGRVTQ